MRPAEAVPRVPFGRRITDNVTAEAIKVIGIVVIACSSLLTAGLLAWALMTMHQVPGLLEATFQTIVGDHRELRREARELERLMRLVCLYTAATDTGRQDCAARAPDGPRTR